MYLLPIFDVLLKTCIVVLLETLFGLVFLGLSRLEELFTSSEEVKLLCERLSLSFSLAAFELFELVDTVKILEVLAGAGGGVCFSTFLLNQLGFFATGGGVGDLDEESMKSGGGLSIFGLASMASSKLASPLGRGGMSSTSA